MEKESSSAEKYHAKTLKGLEPYLAKELLALGAEKTEEVNRGVNFYGGRALMYRANLASRLSLRILFPLFSFRARDDSELYRRIRRYDWSQHLDNRKTFAIDGVVHSPHFSHSHFAVQRVKDAIADRFRELTHLRPSVNRNHPDILINLHISGDMVTLSLDTSGSSLHKRGYRSGNFEAPLNEVLAAGMIAISGWNGDTPFLDPMCGSGTLAIEAALMARNIPPGIHRKEFGFEHWKDFDRDLLEHVVRQLPGEREVKVPIVARDKDPEAVAITLRQLRQMELADAVKVEQGDFEEAPGSDPGTTLMINPPYGERMKSGDLLSLYRMMGTVLKHRHPGTDIWILSSSKKGLSGIGLRPESKKVLYNGSLECTFAHYRTFAGTWKERKERENRS